MAPTTAFGALSAQSWPVRLLRSLAAAHICLIVAVGGHRIAGGEVDSGPVPAAALVLILALSLLLSGRRLILGQMVGLLAIAQLVVHMSCAQGSAAKDLGPTMVTGHVLATVLTAAALARGERFLWALADGLGLRRLELAFSAPALDLSTSRLRFQRRDARVPRVDVLVSGIGLRGPPVVGT